VSRLEALVATIFPRGEPVGESALVALAPDSFEVLSYRELPSGDFLRNPADGAPGAVRHARGLAREGDRLFVTLFNSVGEYQVLDAAGLDLSLGRRLTSPAAADLHGLSLRGGELAVASTGGGCILIWDIESGECRGLRLGAALPEADIRFPCQGPGSSGDLWRDALPGQNHVNDVALAEGGFVFSGLTGIGAHLNGEERILASDDRALFHDARLLEDGRVLATDGARGELVLIDRDSRSQERVAVTEPDSWFLRGVEVVDDHAYLLRSEVVENRQLWIGREEPVRRWGATLGVSVLELRSRRLVSEATVVLPDAPAGSVAYQALAWGDRSPGALLS